MEVQNIQQKIKEGQAAVSALVEKGLKSPAVETVISNGKELLENEQVAKIIEQGKKIAESLKSVRGELEEKVRSAESQGKEILQSRLAEVLERARSIEGELVQLADKAISDGEKLAAEKAPFLTNILGTARNTLAKIDEKFAGVQAEALATTGTLPIRDYDSLNAKAAAAAVKKLGDADLLIIKAYEEKHKNRSTVLNEIASLLGEN